MRTFVILSALLLLTNKSYSTPTSLELTCPEGIHFQRQGVMFDGEMNVNFVSNRLKYKSTVGIDGGPMFQVILNGKTDFDSKANPLNSLCFKDENGVISYLVFNKDLDKLWIGDALTFKLYEGFDSCDEMGLLDKAIAKFEQYCTVSFYSN